ncbi:hypothetical protein [Picrophilus oshimae]|uniref:Uncharacterized protein n=1 Tax=Picrophilus torridus (strain ATCC 700027 / DSM 9790 / JCM 10055 / NBRC 100828 / KAW 2/3) TaxID=1122961 RepID=A0A8G2L7S8_PICTO|nr:hypothetical protein [Picrophilus oshimae]SMD31345.1 hypothetical protein SAMN02745355_1273 [Picrophilus oshimae DSM 9789]
MNKALNMFYASMVLYLFGSVPFVLYAVVIKPLSVSYHENTYSMISPVFGNFGVYISSLEIIELVLITISLALFIVSIFLARASGKKLSKLTLMFPVILYLFAYIATAMAGVVGAAT